MVHPSPKDMMTPKLFFLTILSLSLPSVITANKDEADHHKEFELSIAKQLSNEHRVGNLHPRLTLNAEVAGDETDFVINVREPVQAVTPKTTISEFGGRNKLVGELTNTVLVVDVDEEEAGTIAIIAVDKTTGDVNGIVQKAGQDEKMKITQKIGSKACAYEAEVFVPPQWKCDVGRDRMESTNRKLMDDHKRERNHHENSHSLQHDEHHEHSQHLDGENMDQVLLDIKDSLRGSNVRLGEQHKLQGGSSYNYQVDIYVEVDQALVNNNQGVFNPNTINYINSIVTGANTIYETEIDTHLNVIHIELNGNYDGFLGTVDALFEMKDIYGGSSWHYKGADLHHALLSNNLGGGVAFLGAICDSELGFGLSANLKGDFTSLNSAVVWDMVVFTHEIGHNFNSWHTHNLDIGDGGYDPVIDECLPIGDSLMSCPATLPLAKSATIMSYCHLCDGGMANIDYTFGGKYTGSGSRSDITSYTNAPLAGSISFEPSRVNVVMFDHVSTRGTCTEADKIVNTSPTKTPTDAPTKKPSIIPNMGPTPKIDGPTNGKRAKSGKATVSPKSGKRRRQRIGNRGLANK